MSKEMEKQATKRRACWEVNPSSHFRLGERRTVQTPQHARCSVVALLGAKVTLTFEDSMKRIVDVTDATGFDAALGENIILLCGSYFYAWKLVGVNADHLELADAKLVYETGAWDAKSWQDAQALPGLVWRVMRQSVESWGAAKC